MWLLAIEAAPFFKLLVIFPFSSSALWVLGLWPLPMPRILRLGPSLPHAGLQGIVGELCSVQRCLAKGSEWGLNSSLARPPATRLGSFSRWSRERAPSLSLFTEDLGTGPLTTSCSPAPVSTSLGELVVQIPSPTQPTETDHLGMRSGSGIFKDAR